jgi:tetratricopeptide (TPR) repeat protein
MKRIKINAGEYIDKAFAARDAGQSRLAKKLFIKAAGLLDKKGKAIYWHLAAYCDNDLRKYSDALQSLRKAERYNPTNASIQVTIGIVQLDIGKPKLAQRALEKAIHIKPTAVGYIFLGEAFGRQGRFDKEKAYYRAALRLEPDNEEAHYNLGACYKHERQLGRAERHLRRAIEIDPKYAIAYAELGAVLWKKRSFNESCRMLRRAVRLNPDYYWARLYLANANRRLRHLKEAEKQYREALRIKPDDPRACALLGNFLSAERRANAEKYLKRALALEPANTSALYYMGLHWYRKYQDSQAIYYLKKAVRKGHEKAKKLLDEIKKEKTKNMESACGG